MRALYFILLLLVTSALRGQDEAAIQKAFTSYQSAIGKKDGAEAVKYLDTHSIDYFRMILEDVKNADSLTLESRPMTDKFNVLIIRQMATKKEIHAFTPTTMAIFDFNHGMGGGNNLEGSTLGKFKVKDNTAVVPLMVDGKKTGTIYTFNKEEAQWKINILGPMHDSEKDVRQMIRDSGKSENEFLLGMLELMSGHPVSASIWKKIK